MKPEQWQQIKRLCGAALQRTPGERAQFLSEACEDDDVRREVEILLAAYESNFMEEPVIGEVAEMMVNTAASRLVAGENINHYEILGLIGAGGMGQVYLAHDTRLGRRVALKVLPVDLVSNRERLHRFEQEARAAATLNHPNIAHIYEIGDAKGTNFIAMEFIDGETLREKIHRDQSNLKQLLVWLAQVADGLAKAHAAGIVHRDLKPDNIMISRDGYAKILDFGLAKLLIPSQTASSEAPTAIVPQLLSTPGMIMGTVGYMSPEQARGERQIDARSDIFSFGCLLYEAATRQQPFAGASAVESLHKIIHAQPPPVKDFNPTAPLDLQRVVRRCLAKDPEERYQTIKDVATELKDLGREIESSTEVELSISPKTPDGSRMSGVENETIGARDRTTTSTAEGPAAQTRSSAEYLVGEVRQHKLAVGIVVALLVVIALGTYMRKSTVAKTPIESIAVMPFANASGSADIEYLSDGVTETLIINLSQLPHLSVKARSSVFRYKDKEIDPQKVAADLSVDAIVNGRVVQRGDDLTLYLSLVDGHNGNQLWGQQYNRKMTDLVALQSEIARDISQRLSLRLTSTEQQPLIKQSTQNNEAYQAYLRGRFYWNRGFAPGFEKSREYFQQAIDLDPTYALAYSGLAEYYGFASTVGLLPPNENWPKAEAVTNKALSLDATLAETYNPLAAVKLYYYRDWPAAERAFRRGIELNPNLAEIHAHYAMCLMLFGRSEEALAEVQRSIDLDPLSPRFNFFRGRLLFFMRQYDRAIDQFRQTLEMDPNYLPAHEDLGAVYEQKGMQEGAVAEFVKALILRSASEQATSFERTYAASGFETAIRTLAQDQLTTLNERVKRGEYVAAWEYARIYTRLGDKEQAFVWLDKAVQERNGFVLLFKLDPIYDKLRADPRFSDLLRR
jgi:serine/threonine protein kinase/tetratricopeptide (TPR) repeat protein